MALLKVYLPAEVTDEEIAAAVERAVAETGAASPEGHGQGDEGRARGARRRREDGRRQAGERGGQEEARVKDVVRRVGQRFMVGFEGLTASADVKALIREFGVGHVVLFARNVAGPEQVADLVRELQSVARDAGHERPLLVAVDQEGGRVARLKEPWTIWPSARAVGRVGSEETARQVGAALAAELKACGIRYDFAPCVDVDTNPKNPVIGDRSFGDDPDLVGRLGVAMIRGLQENGVAACAKHFPGHGDTDLDSHLELPAVDHSRSRLDDVELRPFRKAIEAGVATVMTSHILVREIDDDGARDPVAGGSWTGCCGGSWASPASS